MLDISKLNNALRKVKYIKGAIRVKGKTILRVHIMKSLLKKMDEWMRRRIRMVYRKLWNRINSRFNILKKFRSD